MYLVTDPSSPLFPRPIPSIPNLIEFTLLSIPCPFHRYPLSLNELHPTNRPYSDNQNCMRSLAIPHRTPTRTLPRLSGFTLSAVLPPPSPIHSIITPIRPAICASFSSKCLLDAILSLLLVVSSSHSFLVSESIHPIHLSYSAPIIFQHIDYKYTAGHEAPRPHLFVEP